MYVTVRYDIPLSEYEFIPMNTKLEIIPEWSEYTGFIAVKYRGSSLYFNELYFEPALVKIN